MAIKVGGEGRTDRCLLMVPPYREPVGRALR